MRLEIQPVGTAKYPRYIIATSNGEVFDGTGWNRDRNRAVYSGPRKLDHRLSY
jgi:hypothetical protein